jgi:hypothetical protein
MRGTPTAHELAALWPHRSSRECSYNKDFENAVTDDISATIARISVLDDGTRRPVLDLQTAEVAGPLFNILAATLAMTPSATRPPKTIRDQRQPLRPAHQARRRGRAQGHA